MDFRLTEAQDLLVHTARDFFQQHCATTLVQQLALDQRGFPDELWRQISALGWPGLLIPTALGGSDGSLLSCSPPEAAPSRSVSCRLWRVVNASARWR
jgi:alkylation response protein AidB-like acyl-CoA dehydrogenase